MVDPVLVGIFPYRKKITYSVKPLPNMADFCRSVAEEVKCLGLEYPKTIVFCRWYHDCANLYHSLHRDLGIYFAFPPNYPDLHEFRLIEMFTHASTTEMKENVLHSVCSSEGR